MIWIVPLANESSISPVQVGNGSLLMLPGSLSVHTDSVSVRVDNEVGERGGVLRGRGALRASSSRRDGMGR